MQAVDAQIEAFREEDEWVEREAEVARKLRLERDFHRYGLRSGRAISLLAEQSYRASRGFYGGSNMRAGQSSAFGLEKMLGWKD